MSLVRVLEIPPPTSNFHFGGGEVQHFIEVDRFRDDPGPWGPEGAPAPEEMPSEEGRQRVKEMIQSKRYFDPGKAYLVLHEEHSFTIGYEAP